MGWNKLAKVSILAAGAALLATATAAQPVDRHGAHLIAASYSPSDMLSESVAHVAAASTFVHPQDAAVSRKDILGLWILFSLPNKHHS